MDFVGEFLDWAWARHHNPLSWWIRPLFILPFCYFVYKKSVWGIVLTLVAVTTSMFWFPAPAAPDPRGAALLAMERQYLGGPMTLSRLVLTGLIPVWFIALAWAIRRLSWVGVTSVIVSGTVLKLGWLFRESGSNAWVIIPPVALGTAICLGVLALSYWRLQRRRAHHI